MYSKPIRLILDKIIVDLTDQQPNANFSPLIPKSLLLQESKGEHLIVTIHHSK